MEWVKECEEQVKETEERYLRQRELFEKLKQYKGELFKGRLKSATKSLRRDPSISYVAVDSAFKRTQYLHSDFYTVVAVAVCERGFLSNKGEIQIETRGVAEEDEERNNRFLEGLAMSLELELAGEVAPDYKLVLLDGSFHTFLTKLNSAYRQVFTDMDKNPLRCLLQQKFEIVSHYFFELVVRFPTVAVPKASRSRELDSFLEGSPDWKGFLPGDFGEVNTYILLEVLLDEGEYLELEPEEAQTKAWTYPEQFEERNALLDTLKERRKVCFIKGIGGRIFKFEYTLYFDPWFLHILTVGGKELLPLKVADEYAKKFLQEALRPVAGVEEYR